MSGEFSLSREELLGGMPARRASTIVFAIENLTLQLVARSRRALARYQPAEGARDRERQFIAAVGGGRETSARPAIQDIERYTDAWAPLVPATPEVHAAVLHQLSMRYPLARDRVRRIRLALAADSQSVADAYRRQQNREISSAFVESMDGRERLRWWRAAVSERLETMPPFWMAFSLTLTETVGGGMLALPIALAGVGVTGALVLLGVFGLVNILTVAALCEAITRDGKMRYGNGYFGQLVENRLGRLGRVGIAGAMYGLDAIGLLVGLIGFGTVLAGQTGVSALIWVALMFVAVLFVLRRENLNGTIAAALAIGIVILAMAGGMVVLGLLHARPELLGAAAPVSTSVVSLVFGVLLYVYFGHTSAGNAARQVLRRDPTGRTLLLGNVAAMAVAAVIYGLFVVAVNGSVPAERLASETGTAVTPLAEVAGPAVGVLGSVYVLLSLGIGAVFMSLGLFLQTSELIGGRLSRGSLGRFVLAAAPALGVFAVVEVSLYLGEESFTGPLNLVGALILPLLAGVFPMLIVAAARRRGERVPGTSLAWLGSWPVVAVIVALYLGALVADALFIWTDPLSRVAAIVVAVVMAGLIVASVRRGSFRPRTVVELQADEPPGVDMTVGVVADGRAVSERRLLDFAHVESTSVGLPPHHPAELYVWAHQPTRDGDDKPLPAEVEGPDDPAAGSVTIRLASAKS